MLRGWFSVGLASPRSHDSDAVADFTLTAFMLHQIAFRAAYWLLCEFMPRAFIMPSESGAMGRAPKSSRLALAGLSRVNNGCPAVTTCRANASVLPSGAAWATMTWAALDLTNSLRWVAKSAVARRAHGGNADAISRRPPASAGRYDAGIRIPVMPRAGQMTSGCVPRSNRRRHSRSIGVWKPPIIATPASRSSLAKS